VSDKSVKPDLIQVQMWPRQLLRPYPENCRTIRRENPEYITLLENIRARGIQEPLVVRTGQPGSAASPAVGEAQVLNGHCRLDIAEVLKLETLPVRNLGEISDREAFDIVFGATLCVPRSLMEQAHLTAVWLDQYGEDVAAVASKLGKTPRWVVEHAQIYRGLSADWQKAAADKPGAYGFGTWTASHWAVIAKLPAKVQAEQLSKFLGGRHGACDRMTVKDVEDAVKIDLLYLARAPFETDGDSKCHGCLARTGVQPLFLFADEVDGATGAKERCLDPKCWARRCEAALREKFKEAAAAAGVPAAVPLSLLEEPRGYEGREAYRRKISAQKKALKNLVTRDQITLVKEGTKGAVPALVVAGKGKGLRWVKIAEKKETGGGRGGYQPSAEDLAKAAEQNRWGEVVKWVAASLLQQIKKRPAAGITCLLRELDRQEDIKNVLRLAARPEPEIFAALADRAWGKLQESARHAVQYGSCWEKEKWSAIGAVLGFDAQAKYAELTAAEKKSEKREKGQKGQKGLVVMPEEAKDAEEEPDDDE
jgi:hypothetical protein